MIEAFLGFLAVFFMAFLRIPLAVAMAIKSVQDPTREQVRVVHISTGEVVFKTVTDESAAD